MNPGHIVVQIVADDGQADLGPLVGHGYGQPIGKGAFYYIARHGSDLLLNEGVIEI
jgi:hypothetical protein